MALPGLGSDCKTSGITKWTSERRCLSLPQSWPARWEPIAACKWTVTVWPVKRGRKRNGSPLNDDCGIDREQAAMPNIIHCPACQKAYRVDDGMMSKSMKCKGCLTPFTVGEQANVNEPASAAIALPSLRFLCPSCDSTLEVPRSEEHT